MKNFILNEKNNNQNVDITTEEAIKQTAKRLTYIDSFTDYIKKHFNLDELEDA